MGRWYYDQTGNQGKFWFAVQPSDDPKTIYGMSEGEPTMYPISSEKELAASRVVLGLFIYNSIKNNGSCFMTAEL